MSASSQSPSPAPGFRADRALLPRRVLLLTLAVPYPPADRHRMHLWNLLRALCAEGWEITLVSLTDVPQYGVPQQIRCLCREVELVSAMPGTHGPADYGRRISGLFSPEPLDVLQSSSPQLALAVERHLARQEFAAILCDEIYALASLPPNLAVPVIVDTPHVAHELLRRYVPQAPGRLERFYVRLEARKMRRWEARAGAGVYAMAACSAADAAQLRRICPGTRVAILPNVVDVAEYSPATDEAQDDLVLFSGMLDWFPNQDALRFFLATVWPELRRHRPGATFRVTGRCRSVEFLRRISTVPGVETSGNVEDMRRELARAAVFVVPLRIATGTRVTILEAAAMGKAIVATSVAAEGLDFQPGVEIVIADEPDRFALALEDLLANPERRRAIGQRARQRVERDCSLPVLRHALAALLDPLARPKVMAARGGTRL